METQDQEYLDLTKQEDRNEVTINGWLAQDFIDFDPIPQDFDPLGDLELEWI